MNFLLVKLSAKSYRDHMDTLKHLRDQKGYSQSRMARALGLTERTVRNWEAGPVKEHMVHAYCSVLGISYEETRVVTLRYSSDERQPTLFDGIVSGTATLIGFAPAA